MLEESVLNYHSVTWQSVSSHSFLLESSQQYVFSAVCTQSHTQIQRKTNSTLVALGKKEHRTFAHLINAPADIQKQISIH